MIDVSPLFIFATFLAGLLMFLAPCTLPLVPGFLSFLAGNTSGEAVVSKRIVRNTFLYCLGFTLAFTSLGVLAGFVGASLGVQQIILAQIGGILVILLGLSMVGIIPITLLQRRYQRLVPKAVVPGTPTSSFLLGVIFALGWSPCVGPILASVLVLAAGSSSFSVGALLLFVFSLGMMLPFMFTAMFYSRVQVVFSKHLIVSTVFKWIGGGFLIGLGVLLVTNNFSVLVEFGSLIYTWLGVEFIYSYY